ncbi:serine--tRNA ligase, partial [Dysosmobacter welbionis]
MGHDLQQDAVGFRRHLVGQLVGGNLQQGLTGLDGIALRLQPPLHGALLHGQPQLGHFDFRCHCLRSSQQDVHGMLQQIPDCHLEFGRYRAVQQSVVEGQGDPQHLMLSDGAVVLHHQLILRAVDAQNGCVRLVDDGGEALHAEHAQIGHSEGGALVLVSTQLVGTGPLRQILGLGGQGFQAQQVRVPDHRDDEPRVQSHRHAQIHMGPADDLLPVQAHQDLRMTAQGLGHGLQHKVIDREGMALPLQLFAEGQQGGDVHLHRLGDGGDLHSRGVHPLGHHLPHAGELLHRVALHQLQVLHREGGAGDSRRRGDLPISRGGSSCLGRGLRRSQDVPFDDPAAGAGAGEDGVVHAHLSGDLPGQGRDSDPLAPGRRGCRRGRSQRSRRLRRRGSRSRGYSGGSSLPHLFAGLADVGQQSLHRHILALLGHDLQQDAVLLAG